MITRKLIGWVLGVAAAIGVGGACSPTNQNNSNPCAGLLQCGSTCVNAQSDPNNCGNCGIVCGAGLVCSNGACSASCAAGLAQCAPGSCENLMTSSTSCGSCGTVCQGGATCQNGSCVGGGGEGVGGNGSGGGDPGNAGGSDPGNAGGSDPGSGGGSNNGSGGGGNNPGEGPVGYWTNGTWSGCAWTGKEGPGGMMPPTTPTTIMPADFTTRAPADAYCASGSVGNSYEAVALMGFNVNESAATANCTAGQTPTGLNTVTPTKSGIAANIVKQGADTSFTFRVQVQGPEGETNPEDRWCATVTATQGKVFVPFSDFYTECWGTTPATKGTQYSGQPISAVVFLVPGKPTATPYNFCVNGFAEGETAAEAPDGPVQIGEQKGTVGFAGPRDGDFDRAKVTVGGKEYIIQNNNWGNPEGTNLILNYTNNGFKIVEGSGSSPGNGIPASFPSIYIGANGNTRDGVMATSGTDNLPKRISEITSVPTSFAWSGSTGSFNATYDVWFANSPPSAAYNDGIDGFVMVWAYKPPNEQPIGSVQGTFANGGQTYDVWVGPRGNGPEGPNDAPVVSFVARNTIQMMDFDLKPFFNEAVSRYGLPSNTYLTDVFFGFEIWNGGAGGNLSVDKFTCEVR